MISRKSLFASVAALCLGTSGAATAADVYAVDTSHSTVLFRIKHMNVSYSYGLFSDVTGTVTIDHQDPTRGALDIKVATDSLDTNNPKRDQHLKSPDFLNAKQFPAITFKSTKIAAAGPHTYDVTGDLTLHGATHPVTISLVHTGSGKGPTGGELVGFETTFAIKRSEFGMTNMVGPVGDEVRITVALEAAKK
jgi:polyisoprenoid-binding protein YceI